MKIFRLDGLVLGLLLVCVQMSCDKNGDIVIFSIENDKQLGMQVAEQIASDTSFVILDETEYADAYMYLNSIKNKILNSGKITYKDEFVWKLHIIEDDVLNAFATPGGYIYVYTGLIKYLNKVDDLAGVLGHEIAHADQRHSSKQLQRQYGIQILLSVALGKDASQLEQVVASIAGTGAILAFSRDAEAEADEYSVEYLAQTDYSCNGAASFFEKLLADGQSSGIPEFLSTHPDAESRVEDINAKANELGCDTSSAAETGMDYHDFKAIFN